jgi:hypothetical protein
MMDDPIWLNDDYYYTISAGQFGYGWDLYRKGGKLVAMSGAYCPTRQVARDEAFAAIPQIVS